MKKFKNLILSAVIGGAIALGGFHLIQPENKTLQIEHISAAPVQGAAYTVNEEGDLIPLNFTDAAEKVMASVVHIKSTQSYTASRQRQYRNLPDPFRDFFGDDFYERFFGPRTQPDTRNPQARVGTGSGVIINSEGYIVTNNHVIDKADDIEVTLHDNRTYKATVVGVDPTTDLALIQIKEKDLPALPLVNSDDVKVGEWVLAVGNPFNLTSTVTAGIVSAKARNINILSGDYAIESFIQTDAAINPGNSGGALVNLQGGLIGINTAIASPTGAYSGYGFAVPSNIVNKVVEDLLKYGAVQRGVLGVKIINVTSNLAQEKELDFLNQYEGVYVDTVTENSGAEEAGIKPGDIILGVDGRDVRSSAELIGIIGRKRPGDEVELKVNRKGKIRNFDVKLKNLYGNDEVLAKSGSNAIRMLGAEFETLDSKKAETLSIPGGVRVRKLYPGKLTRETQMEEGFIITKVDGKPVDSVEELSKALEDKQGGVMLEGIYEHRAGVYYYAFGL